jgi:hypothetical protein
VIRALAFALALLAALPVRADMSDEARGRMMEAVRRDNARFNGGDYASAMDAVPPLMIAAMAQAYGMPLGDFIAQSRAAYVAAMQDVTVEDQQYGFGEARYDQTKTGRDYAVFQVTTVVRTPQGRLRQLAVVLAFEDEGRWYQVHVGRPRAAGFLGVGYPDFAGLTFPADRVEPADKPKEQP